MAERRGVRRTAGGRARGGRGPGETRGDRPVGGARPEPLIAGGTAVDARDADDVEEANAGGGADGAGAGGRVGGGRGLVNGRRHVVDRALDYAALAATEGLSDVQIARRRRKSRPHVWVLRRLGDALAGLHPDEIEAFRSPRITFTIVQKIVKAGMPAAEVRAQLRDAMSGMSSHNVRRGGRQSGGGASEGPAPPHRRGAAGEGSAVIRGYSWDAALFARSPAEYVRMHVERLRGIQDFVAKHASRDVRGRAVRGLGSAVSIRRLEQLLRAQRAVGGGEGAFAASAEEQRALEALRLLTVGMEQAFAGALDHMAAEDRVRSAREGRRADGQPTVIGATSGGREGGGTTGDEVASDVAAAAPKRGRTGDQEHESGGTRGALWIGAEELEADLAE